MSKGLRSGPTEPIRAVLDIGSKVPGPGFEGPF